MVNLKVKVSYEDAGELELKNSGRPIAIQISPIAPERKPTIRPTNGKAQAALVRSGGSSEK